LLSVQVAVYTPEEGISIDMLAADIKHLKQVFKEDLGSRELAD
jgi:6-phosphofructokinase 1